MKNLNDIPKKDIFKVPEGYFDELPDKIRERMEASKKEEAKPTFIQAVKPYLYFAAFFIGLAVIIKTGLNVFTGDYHNPVITANIQPNDDTSYFEYDMITEEMIYEELSSDEYSSDDNELNEEIILAYLTADEVSSLVINE